MDSTKLKTRGSETETVERPGFRSRIIRGIAFASVLGVAAMLVGPAAIFTTAGASIGGSNDCMQLSNGQTLTIGASVVPVSAVAGTLSVAVVQNTVVNVWLPAGVSVTSDSPSPGVTVRVHNNLSLANYRADIFVKTMSGTDSAPVAAQLGLGNDASGAGTGYTNQPLSVFVHN